MGSDSIHPVMVGTAGHIDHGKSSLVLALTGIDPDRLKEEKERGLTIDLGFAGLKLADGRTMGMVDVPGHERLVRNMVAGSTALDIALLVVAADDGVMPQTIEHLEILDLLGVRRGVIALTKIDLVDGEVADLAEDEVRELVAGTVLDGAPLIRVSTATGEGVDAVRDALETSAASLTPKPHHGPFRMPVQRVFQLKGIGTVVTGVPMSGAVEPGDTVEFLPGGHTSKVRAVQAFGAKVSRAVAGHSTALSVPDARAVGLGRGVVAAAPGIFSTGTAVDVELRLISRARPIRHRRPVRFHSGTCEVQGYLLLLDRDELRAGETVVARVLLSEEVCVAPGDPVLLRLQNPVMTIGGGSVLRLTGSPRRYRRAGVGEELYRLKAAGSNPEGRVVEELTLAGAAGLTPAELAAGLAVGVDVVRAVMEEDDQIFFHERGSRAFLRTALQDGERELMDSVGRLLRDKPLAASVKRSSFRPSRALPAPLLDALLEEMQKDGRVRTGTHGRVLFLERLKPLPEDDQRVLDDVVRACETAEFRPPTRPELSEKLSMPAARLDELIARAVDEGLVEEVGDHVYGAATVRSALVAIRSNCLANGEELNIPDLRDQLGTSRKFLIPLLEYVDGLGLTRLRAGVRCLLPSSVVCQQLEALEASSADGA